MSSVASRIIRFNNNASLQNLIQRHFLGPSAVADGAVPQLLNKVTESRLASPFGSENQIAYLNTLQAHWFDASEAMKKKNSSDRDVSMFMFGLSGIDQSGNVKIRVRRRADFDEDVDGDDDADGYYDDFPPTSNADSGDEGFGKHDGGFNDSEDDDDEDSTGKREFRK